MKRFAAYTSLLFLTIVFMALGMDCVNLGLTRASSANPAYKMERLYGAPEVDEVAIVGSSRALTHLVPSRLSPKSFNYGVSGMGMREAMTILEVLRARRTSAPVILNFDPWGGWGEWGADGLKGDYRLVPQRGHVAWVDRIPGVRFFGMLRKDLVSYLNMKGSVTKIVDRGAELIKTSRTAEEWAVIRGKTAVCAFEHCAKDETALCDLLTSLAPRQVYVLVSPCAACWKSKFIGKTELDGYLNRLEKIPNVRLFNYFEAPEFSDADFVDPTHLNVAGAMKLSSRFSHDSGLGATND